jgi:uracil-DNA glycosylase
LELQSLSRQSLVDFLPAHLFDQLHEDWQEILSPLADQILKIEKEIITASIAPDFVNIFRSLSSPIDQAKIVIFGQDPYPTKGHAHGLAFSVEKSVVQLPPTLRNIFTELSDDAGIHHAHGDLSAWSEQGVLLVNRILSVAIGESMSHAKLGWQEITDAVAAELGKRDVVAILWGKYAGELAPNFRQEWIVQSVHPSPLAAYRGFFGSKPFTSSNKILQRNGIAPIAW